MCRLKVTSRIGVRKSEGDEMQHPVVDIGTCNLCGGCIEICPEVFKLSENSGIVEVEDLEEYPVDGVDEAIKNCPLDCISWEE